MSSRPRRRMSLQSQMVGAELTLFDPNAGHFHTLNPTATLVWSACDGTATPEIIAAQTDLPLPHIELALAEFAQLGLLSETTSTPTLTRKDAVRRIATAGLLGVAALPVVASITGADRAAADSCLPSGACCPTIVIEDCVSTYCCSGVLPLDVTCTFWKCA